jgi:hypothetical protein
MLLQLVGLEKDYTATDYIQAKNVTIGEGQERFGPGNEDFHVAAEHDPVIRSPRGETNTIQALLSDVEQGAVRMDCNVT